MVTEKQSEAIDLLLCGHKVSDVARTVGVNRQSIYNWLAKSDVKAEMGKRQGDARSRGKNKIIGSMERYIDNMNRLTRSKDDRIALQANKYMLDRVLGAVASEAKQGDKDVSREVVDTESLKEKFTAHLKAVK